MQLIATQYNKNLLPALLHKTIDMHLIARSVHEIIQRIQPHGLIVSSQSPVVFLKEKIKLKITKNALKELKLNNHISERERVEIILFLYTHKYHEKALNVC